VVGAHRLLAAVVLGLLVGLVGVRILSHRPNPTSTNVGDPAEGGSFPGNALGPPPSTNADPSGSALFSLIVTQDDVAAPSKVALLPGGNGVSRATLDLCNGRFPSESQRTARLQDVVTDGGGEQPLSTEAVLYGGPAGPAQAFSELAAVSAACPATPVAGPNGAPPVVTRFDPAPDGTWPQTTTVSRMAFDFTTTDALGRTSHTIAVYLQRGRVLMGVYFFHPDGIQASVAGQTTIPGIVAVFAGRMAALPTSVVGS